MATDQENAENIENTENISEDSKPDKAKKEDNFFRDKLLIPIGATVIAGFIASYLSNYLTKQASYNDLVDKYTARLKEIVVSDKLNSLRSETAELKKDKEYLEKKIEKKENTIDLDKLSISRKSFVDGYLLAKDTLTNTPTNTPNLEPTQIESILKYIQGNLKQKENERAQIRGLMNTITVNTLISLSENDAFIPWFSNTFLSFIPFFKSRNIERRDVIINALRLSELGIGNRLDGKATFPLFLEDTTIGGYSLQTGAVISLRNIDLTIGYLNGSTFTLVDLGEAKFNYAELNGSSFSESSLNDVNFAKTKMKRVTFKNSSVKNSTFEDSFLKGLRAISDESNRICAKLFLGITLTSKGRKCNTVDFSGSSFLNSDLSDSKLINSILVGVNLTNANLTNADLTDADLTDADLTNANLTNANLTNANLSGVKGLKDKQKTLKDILKEVADKNNIRLCNTSSSYDERNEINTIFEWFQMFFNLRDNGFFVLFINCENANLSNKTLNLQQEKENDIKKIKWDKANMTNTIIQMDIMDLNDKLPDKNKKQVDQKLEELFKGAKFCNTLLLFNKQAINYGLGPRISNNCEGENLSDKNLSGSFWTKVNLTNANLENSILDIKSLADAILCNTILPNGIKSFKHCKKADLSKQSLNEKLSVKGLNLKDVDFTGANLSYVDLSGANLTKAKLIGADLTNAKIIGADLTNAKIIGADLTNANLENSILDSKSLAKVKKLCNTILPDRNKSFKKCQDADLTNADLTNPDLTNADLTNADLSTVKGLKLQQLEKAILCHTKLPAKLAAQNIENRDCPKK